MLIRVNPCQKKYKLYGNSAYSTGFDMVAVREEMDEEGALRFTATGAAPLVRTIVYDTENRIESITENGSTITFYYDAGGNRIRKTENGVNTYYFFSTYEEEVNGGVTTKISYYFANGQRIAQRTDNGTEEELLYIHTDHLGSAVRLTNTSGEPVKSILYEPFGKTIYMAGTKRTAYQFTDQEYDGGTGLYYYGARYYDPEIGRFIQADTVLDGLNRYAYCHNNPVMYVDPTGHYEIVIPEGTYNTDTNQLTPNNFKTVISTTNGTDRVTIIIGYIDYPDNNYDGIGNKSLENTPGQPPPGFQPPAVGSNNGNPENYSSWKDRFVSEMHKQIGMRYVSAGGNYTQYKQWSNIDENGNWVGFDCSGGIMHALRTATGIDMAKRKANGMLSAPWLYEITEEELEEGDLILVDIPGTKKVNGLRTVDRDEAGNPVYRKYNHVMTYINKTEKGMNIITTEGEGGDFRKNPASKTTTRYWNLSSFKQTSGSMFENTTRYKYMRVNWGWLSNWKNTH